MQEFIATFHIDWKLMLAQIVNFGLVFLAFYLLAAKPLRKLLKEPEETISKGLSDSEKAKELLKKGSDEYQAKTAKLRQMSAEAEKELKRDLGKLRAENLEKIKRDEDEWTRKKIAQMEIDKKA